MTYITSGVYFGRQRGLTARVMVHIGAPVPALTPGSPSAIPTIPLSAKWKELTYFAEQTWNQLMSTLHLEEAKHCINIMYHLASEEKPSPDKRGLSFLFYEVGFTLVQPS